ncbi:ITPR1 [Branchiostoma lanceolatum]|uniref:ITPR1 protein n=1 Tax=Branchiostoma lanceolatum TaxID=7740 RepID=A0A8J9VFY1_BRALA|nr:ITPR1 [Branchiostoma lanceolatum]
MARLFGQKDNKTDKIRSSEKRNLWVNVTCVLFVYLLAVETYVPTWHGAIGASDEGMAWDGASLQQLGMVDRCMYDDAFTIQQVNAEHEVILNYAAGILPVIKHIIEYRKDGNPVTERQAADCIETLKELSKWQIVKGEPIKDRQKLLRNLRIIELLIKLLGMPYRGSDDKRHLIGIFVEAYNALFTYLIGDSRKNELYMARHTSFIHSQIKDEGEVGLAATKMLMELVHDNRKIVDRINKAQIDTFINLLMRNKDYRYLEMLGVLCVCDDVAIPENQEYITKVWLCDQDAKACVYHTELGPGIGKEADLVYVSTTNRRRWTPLHEFVKTADEQSILFLNYQLDLFEKLCFGGNEFAISVITKELKYLTWEEAFLCLSDDRLPDQLRAVYCRLINGLFVDVTSNCFPLPLDYINLSFIWDDLKDGGTVGDEVQQPNTPKQASLKRVLPTLQKWISKFLHQNKDMTASLIGHNMLIEQVLHLVYSLVQHGYYSTEADVTMLTGPMFSLLDGRNDKPCPPNTMNSEQYKKQLQSYQETLRYRPSKKTKAIVDAKLQALKVLKLLLNHRFNTILKRFVLEFRTTLENSQAAKLFTSNELEPMLYENYDPDEDDNAQEAVEKKLRDIAFSCTHFDLEMLKEIIMDVSNYKYDQMVVESMDVLNIYYSTFMDLFRRSDQSKVLMTEKSCEVHREVLKDLPVFRKLVPAKLSNDNLNTMCGILDKFIGFCCLPGDPGEPHPVNQAILYNFYVLESVLEVLFQKVDMHLQEQYSRQQLIFKKCFKLLRVLARGNEIVQLRLFERLDDLLKVKGAEVEMAKAITEIFTGFKLTCLKVQQHHVEQVWELVEEHGEMCCEFLDLLNAIVKVEELDLPLKRNQSFVMKFFMQFRSEVAGVIDRSAEERMTVFTATQNIGDLRYMMGMVNVLATCAEGENRFIESICQTIFSVDELFQILTNDKIDNNLKRPFLRFLLWVYLNTAGSVLDSGVGELAHDPRLWEYLKGLCLVLKMSTDYVKENPAKAQYQLKKPPSKWDESADLSNHGTLHYIFEAIMPFLQVFFRQYYSPERENYPEEADIVDLMAKSLLNFIDGVGTLISNMTHQKNMVNCMTSILSVATLPVRVMEDFQSTYGSGGQLQDIRSDAKKEYERYYSSEEELNEQLNTFANNCMFAYCGENTVQVQIDFPSDREYNDKVASEELPLAEEFQDHLKCFIDLSKTAPKERYAMAEKLIEQLHISSNNYRSTLVERIQQEKMDIKCLQLLRAMIHNEERKLPGNWEMYPKKNKKKIQHLKQVQMALADKGALLKILPLISRDSDDLIAEVLALLAAMLYGGNEHVQDCLMDFFIGSREEMLFSAFKSRMELSAVITTERRLLEAQHKAELQKAMEMEKALSRAVIDGKTAMAAVKRHGSTASMMSIMSARGRGRIKTGRKRGQSSKSRKSAAASRPEHGQSRAAWPTPPAAKTPQKGTEPANGGIEMTSMKQTAEALLRASQANVGEPSTSADGPTEVVVDNAASSEHNDLIDELEEPIDEVLFEDDGNIELVLRVLGMMCDAQHTKLQDYIREQPDNMKSFNLVAETTLYLQLHYSNINSGNVRLVTSIFNTLFNLAVGNSKNQAIIFDTKAIDYINFILRETKFNGADQLSVVQLKTSIGNLLKVIIEENANDAALAKEIKDLLDEEAVNATLVDSFLERKRTTDETLKKSWQHLGFTFFHILKRFLDLDSTLDPKDFQKTEDAKQAWAFFEGNTLSVEVIKDNEIQKVHFRIRKKDLLRNEVKEKLKWSVDRSSPSNKIRDFIDWSKDIRRDINYQAWVRSHKLAAFFIAREVFWNRAIIFLTLVINIFMLSTWNAPCPQHYGTRANATCASPEPKTPHGILWSRDNGPYEVTIYVLGGIHNILSFCLMISFFLSNRLRLPDWNNTKEWCSKNFLGIEILNALKQRVSKLEIQVFSLKTLYYVAYLIFSILGTVFYGYFFCFHLIHIAVKNQLLIRVISSVTLNGRSLLWVCVLAIIFIYIYAVIGFAFFRGHFNEEKGQFCESLGQCFVSTMRYGLMENLHKAILPPPGVTFVAYALRLFWYMAFWVTLIMVGLRLIFGIVVGGFVSLRNKKWQADFDMANICFICGRTNYDFERFGKGFRRHVKNEHNMWSYLFFFIHLDETNETQYTAIEFHVAKLMQNEAYEFFPVNRALSLDNKKDAYDSKLDNLVLQVDQLVKRQKEEDAQKRRQEEKMKQREWEEKHRADSAHTPALTVKSSTSGDDTAF